MIPLKDYRFKTTLFVNRDNIATVGCSFTVDPKGPCKVAFERAKTVVETVTGWIAVNFTVPGDEQPFTIHCPDIWMAQRYVEELTGERVIVKLPTEIRNKEELTVMVDVMPIDDGTGL
jgi:predicted trehalose synthase